MDWVRDVDWSVLGWMVLAGVLGFPRLLDALDRIGKLPRSLRRWTAQRAEALVEAEHREEVLDQLAKNSEAILAQVTKNGGTSLLDAVTRIEGRVASIEHKLDAHLEENAPLMERAAGVERDLRAHLEGHGA